MCNIVGLTRNQTLNLIATIRLRTGKGHPVQIRLIDAKLHSGHRRGAAIYHLPMVDGNGFYVCVEFTLAADSMGVSITADMPRVRYADASASMIHHLRRLCDTQPKPRTPAHNTRAARFGEIIAARRTPKDGGEAR